MTFIDKRARSALATISLCGGILSTSLFPTSARAGAEEDYVAATKMYATGDVINAMSKLQPAADAGHAGAQALYALILSRADSDEEAIRYFRMSAEQGNSDGQFGYGSMIAAGDGIKADPIEARKWILAAANQGHPEAVNAMALAYMNGGLGLRDAPRDDATALGWIVKAAESGFIPAMDALSKAYASGGYGLPADAKLATEWTAKLHKQQGLKKKRAGDRK